MDDQLKTLFEYTKWHIGLYSVLIGALIGIFEFYGEDISSVRPYLATSLVALIVAGAAGGVVGSGIPYYRKFDDFMGDRHLFLRLGQCKWGRWASPSGRCWTHVEHAAFWVAIGSAAVGVLGLQFGLLPISEPQTVPIPTVNPS